MMRRVLAILAAVCAFGAARGDDEGLDEDLRRRVAGMAADEQRLRAGFAHYAPLATSPGEGIVVPLETYPDGSVRTSVLAGKAQFFQSDGLVWCSDALVRQFDASGRETMSLKCAAGLFDRNTKTGWLEGPVEGRYDRTDLFGRGVYFSVNEEYVRIASEVVIVSRDLKFEGVKL